MRRVITILLAAVIVSAMLATGCAKKDASGATGTVKVVDPGAQKANIMKGNKERMGGGAAGAPTTGQTR